MAESETKSPAAGSKSQGSGPSASMPAPTGAPTSHIVLSNDADDSGKYDDDLFALAVLDDIFEVTSYQGFSAKSFRAKCVNEKNLRPADVFRMLAISTQIGNNPSKLVNAAKVTDAPTCVALHGYLQSHGFAVAAGGGTKREFTLARLEIAFLIPAYLIRRIAHLRGKLQNQFPNTVDPPLQSPSMGAIADHVRQRAGYEQYQNAFRVALGGAESQTNWLDIAINGAADDDAFKRSLNLIGTRDDPERLVQAARQAINICFEEI